ncbi:MAG: sigma-70 factor domain-containing protein, partial [Humibacter sp.]
MATKAAEARSTVEEPTTTVDKKSATSRSSASKATAAKAKTASKAPAKTATKATSKASPSKAATKASPSKASKAEDDDIDDEPEDLEVEELDDAAVEVVEEVAAGSDDAKASADSDADDSESDAAKAEVLPTGAIVLRAADEEDDVPVYSAQITGATADPVKDYLKQIGKVALLNAAEEVELAMRIEAGLFAEEKLGAMTDQEKRSQLGRDLGWVARDGQRAKSHLLGANLRLVVSLAKRYTGRGMQFLDLIQEGNL